MRKLLKQFIAKIEKGDVTVAHDVLDSLYEMQMEQMMQKQDGSNRFGYRIYWVRMEGGIAELVRSRDGDDNDATQYAVLVDSNEDNTIEEPREVTLQEAEKLLASSSSITTYIPLVCRVAEQFRNVGLSVWEAQYLLLEFLDVMPECRANEDDIHNPFGNAPLRILELGCGAGLTGAYVLRNSFLHKHIEALYLSDYQQIIMDNVEQNLKLNQPHQTHSTDQIPIVTSLLLDWTQYDKFSLQSLNCNMILAADVVYDVQVIEPLANLVADLISMQPSLVCYFFITKRRETTFELFRKALDDRSLTCEEYSRRFGTLIEAAEEKRGRLLGTEDLYERDSVRIFRVGTVSQCGDDARE